jgi:hypothetical protein
MSLTVTAVPPGASSLTLTKISVNPDRISEPWCGENDRQSPALLSGRPTQ